MITDHDVIQYFRDPSRRIPVQVLDISKIGANRQIMRGIHPLLWKDKTPYGCGRHYMVFNQHKVIPEYCFDCYKILISPRTVLELFKLLMIFDKIELPIDNTRKLMVEERKYCSGTYKGFVFCRGIEDANEVLKIVQAAVYEDISTNVPVAIKRGCSEFEVTFPEFSKAEQPPAMTYNEDWRKFEEMTEEFLAAKGYVKHDIGALKAGAPRMTYTPGEILGMQYWTRYASTIGDMSYIKLIGQTIPTIPNLVRPRFNNPA
jgi:hypothetical protein